MAAFHKFDTLCLRYFNTYGARQTFTPYVGVITIFINRLLRGQAPVVFGSGKQIRDFIHVDDIVNANIQAMNSPLRSAVVNVGSGRGLSVNQIAQLLIERIQPRLKARYGQSRGFEPANSVASTRQAKRLLHFTARNRLEDKITEVIDYIRQKGAGPDHMGF
jgi:UDP-glucose 4-epimerase